MKTSIKSSFNSNWIIVLFVLSSIKLFAQTDTELGLATGLVYNQIGYATKSQKTIFLLDNQSNLATHNYTLIDQNSNLVLSGQAQFVQNEWRRNVYVIDITSIENEGTYVLTSGNYAAQIKISSKFIEDLHVNEYFDELFQYQRTAASEWLPVLNRVSSDVNAMNASDFINTGKVVEKRGGWKDAHSNDQHLSHARVVTALLTSFEENSALFENDLINSTPKIIHEAKWGLDFLMSIQSPSGYFYGRLNSDQYTAQHPVRSVINDSSSFYNLLGVAALAQGYTVLKDSDPIFAGECLNSAIQGWNWFELNPEIHNNSYSYWTARFDAKLLAAFELWRATNDSKYKNILDNGILSSELKSPQGRGWEAWWHSNSGPSNVYDFDGWFGMENFFLNSNILLLYGKYYEFAPDNVQLVMLEQADFIKDWLSSRSQSSYNFYDIYFVNYFGMSGDAALTSAMLSYFGYKVSDTELFNIGMDHFDFVLGKNPLGKSFVAEIGTNLHNNLWRPTTMDVKGSLVAGIIQYNQLPTANANLLGDVNTVGWQVDEVLMTPSSFMLFNFSILDKRAKEIVTSTQDIFSEIQQSQFIFPNPAISSVRVSESYESLDFYDLSGQLVLHVAENLTDINITSLSPGSYLVRLKSNDKILSSKLVINK